MLAYVRLFHLNRAKAALGWADLSLRKHSPSVLARGDALFLQGCAFGGTEQAGITSER
jgi:hypothetical protein